MGQLATRNHDAFTGARTCSGKRSFEAVPRKWLSRVEGVGSPGWHHLHGNVVRCAGRSAWPSDASAARHGGNPPPTAAGGQVGLTMRIGRPVAALATTKVGGCRPCTHARQRAGRIARSPHLPARHGGHPPLTVPGGPTGSVVQPSKQVDMFAAPKANGPSPAVWRQQYVVGWMCVARRRVVQLFHRPATPSIVDASVYAICGVRLAQLQLVRVAPELVEFGLDALPGAPCSSGLCWPPLQADPATLAALEACARKAPAPRKHAEVAVVFAKVYGPPRTGRRPGTPFRQNNQRTPCLKKRALSQGLLCRRGSFVLRG